MSTDQKLAAMGSRKYQRNPNLVDFILEEPEALVDRDFSV